MKWTEQAEDAISKVPFFVRKKVRKRVEKEAGKTGKDMVTLAEVKATQTSFLAGMGSQIRGYQIENCFGSGGCPNKIYSTDSLVKKIEALFKQEDILLFLKQRVNGDLKFHHEFRVAIAECPNACSQPQIKGIGIIAASLPKIIGEQCTGCGVCVDACGENAIKLTSEPGTTEIKPEITFNNCLMCGKCTRVCPTQTIVEKTRGYRVQLGGRLGRHPRLAMELPGIYSQEQVFDIVKKCIIFYKKKSLKGERFSNLLTMGEFQKIAQTCTRCFKNSDSTIMMDN